jgi:hypothetical protein
MYRNYGLQIGNFLNDDSVTNVNVVAEMCLLEGAQYVDRVFRKKSDPSRRSNFPLFGGSVDLTYASSISSHLLAVRYNDGSANLWAVKSDTGSLVKILGLQNKDKQIRGIKMWSNEALVLYSDNTISFMNPKTIKTYHMLPETLAVETEEPPMAEQQQQIIQQLDAVSDEPVLQASSHQIIDQQDLTASQPTPESQPDLERQPQITETVLEQANDNQSIINSDVPERYITHVAPAQYLNKLVVGYNDSRVDVVDLTSSIFNSDVSYDLRISQDPSDNSRGAILPDPITSIEVGLVYREKASKTDKFVWVAFVGFTSGRIVCISLESYERIGIDYRKSMNTLETKDYGCLSLHTLDNNLVSHPCVQPADTDTPYFVQQEMEKQLDPSDPNRPSSMIRINDDVREASRRSYVSPNLYLLSMDAKLGFVCPIVVEICLYDAGLQMLSGEINVELVSEEGHVLFYAEIHPLKVRVGHLPQNSSSPADLVEVLFEFDLESIPLDKTTKVVITHDITQKKYRLYAGSDLAGIQTYEQDVPPNLALRHTRVHVSGSPPQNYENMTEYTQDYIKQVNLYYKQLVAIKDLKLSAITPDVICTWQEDFARTAGHLVCLRNRLLQVFSIKSNRSLKLRHQVESKQQQTAPWICGHAIIYDKIEYVTLNAAGIVQFYSLPNLVLHLTTSVMQPHLIRGPAPTSFCVAEENNLIFAGNGTLLQVIVVHQTDTSNYVFEPILYAETPMPEKQLRPTGIVTQVNQMFGGFSQFASSLFNPATSQQKQQTSTTHQHAGKYFDQKIDELFARVPQQTSQQQPLQQATEKLNFEKTGNKRTLLAPNHVPKPTKNQIASATNNEQMVHDAKRAELLGSETSGYKRSPVKSTSQAQNKINETKNVMNENLQKLDERGEKLRNIEQRTQDMSLQAQSFAQKAAMLRKKNSGFGLF